jgi:hypothetical protein
VTFATEWWNAKKLVADSPGAVEEATSCAATWLEQASAQVSRSEISVAEEKRRITFRRLLLFYPLQGVAANIIRGVFYLFIGALILEVGIILTDILESTNYYIKSDLVYLIVAALGALVLRFWAVFAQNPKGKERKVRLETIRRALLFYRLGGFAASLVRIVFYVYIVCAVAYISSVTHFVWNDPRLLPYYIAWIIALAGFAVGLRHWAAVLGTARGTETTRHIPPPGISIQGPETAPIANQWWQRIPDHGPGRNAP